jgi:hypothetical protein
MPELTKIFEKMNEIPCNPICQNHFFQKLQRMSNIDSEALI